MSEMMSDEKIKEVLEQNAQKSSELLKNKDELEEFLQQLERKLSIIPIGGTVLAEIPTLISLVRNWIMQIYTAIPTGTLIAVIGALIYVLSPVDIIPDFIPGAGYVDDALVLSTCLSLVHSDLDDYRKWRKENGIEA